MREIVAVLTATDRWRRRSRERQMVRRRLERMIKMGAVAVARLCRARGLTWERIGALVHVQAATLRRWCAGWRDDRLAVQARGRPLERASTELRNAVLAVLGLMGPGTSVSILRELFPRTARRELEDLVARYRRVYRKRGVLLHQLQWENRGAVWAMDFTEAPRPVDATFPYLLIVRDLASGNQLLALPSRAQDGQSVRDALAALFAVHGAPLVIKSDNGSAFISNETRDFLADRSIALLLSPVGTPSYNGACEAGIGAIAVRAHHEAARHGRPGHWTCDDVEAARRGANETARPLGALGPTPDERWQCRLPTDDDERTRLHRVVEELKTEVRVDFDDGDQTETSQRVEDAISRIAICRALVQLGYLQLRRRRFTHQVSYDRTIINS